MAIYFAVFLTFILRDDHERMIRLGPGTNMYICLGSTLPAVYDKIWIAKLVNETIMLILALRKGIENLRQFKESGASSKLLPLLVKDSVLYFLGVFALCLMSQLVWVCAGPRYIELSIGITFAFSSIMSQRLVVNVRKKAKKGEMLSIGTISDPQLQRPTGLERSDGGYTGSFLVGTRTDAIEI